MVYKNWWKMGEGWKKGIDESFSVCENRITETKRQIGENIMARKFFEADETEVRRDNKRNKFSAKEQRKAARANKFANATRWQDETKEWEKGEKSPFFLIDSKIKCDIL